MAKKQCDFRTVFEKMAELKQEVIPQELDWISQADIDEYDEIRVLRQIVMDVQKEPRVYFATT